MKHYYLYCFLFCFLSITAISAQIQIPEGYVPGNRTMSASLEKNILFNATSRYTVTQTGKQGFDSNELSKLFDGSMDVNYTWGIPITSDNPMVIEIDNLPDIHTQMGAWIGFSTRYWPAKKFKIEGWDSWSTHNWVTISDIDNNTNEQYIVKAPYCAITKLKFTFYDGCSTSCLPYGQMGLSEIYFIHPEAAQAYDGLLLKCNVSGSVGIGTTAPSTILQIAKADSKTNLDLTNSAALDIWNPDVNGNTGGQINFRSDVNTGPSGIGAVIGYLNKNSNGSGSSGDLVFGVKNTNTDASVIHAMTIQQGGNVGIGTSSPGATLDIKGDANLNNQFSTAPSCLNPGYYVYKSGTIAYGMKLQYTEGKFGTMIFGPNESGRFIGFGKVGDALSDSKIIESMRIDLNNGYVGIGTPTPGAKLDVNGIINTNADIQLGSNQANSYLKLNTNSQSWWAGVGVNSNDGRFVIYDQTTNTHALTIGTDGNVGIGIGTAQAVCKLEVNGTIHAKEVLVDINAPLADFVFHPSYKLMPLTQVEQYVKTNSHLPEIPSAAEVSKNGMSIGEMQNKLLQKVEELTLYAIELQKTVNQQNVRIEELEKNK